MSNVLESGRLPVEGNSFSHWLLDNTRRDFRARSIPELLLSNSCYVEGGKIHLGCKNSLRTFAHVPPCPPSMRRRASLAPLVFSSDAATMEDISDQ